jgi:hypothetical protein
MQAECASRLKSTLIQVKAVPATVRYDYSKTLAEITRMGPPTAGYVTTGLTVSNTSYETSLGASALRYDDGFGCMRPQVSVTLRLVEHTVYVAREFAPGSCAHRDTLSHENIHVKLNERQLEDAARRLRVTLQKQLGNQIYYGDVTLLQTQLGDALQNEWLGVARQRMEDGRAEHAAFDKHQLEEAARACPQERQRLVAAALAARKR